MAEVYLRQGLLGRAVALEIADRRTRILDQEQEVSEGRSQTIGTQRVMKG